MSRILPIRFRGVHFLWATISCNNFFRIVMGHQYKQKHWDVGTLLSILWQTVPMFEIYVGAIKKIYRPNLTNVSYCDNIRNASFYLLWKLYEKITDTIRNIFFSETNYIILRKLSVIEIKQCLFLRVIFSMLGQ